jgi:hypothetical protein
VLPFEITPDGVKKVRVPLHILPVVANGVNISSEFAQELDEMS